MLALYFFMRALKTMLAKWENIRDAVKSFNSAFWITVSVCCVGVHGQEGKKNSFIDAFDKIKNVTRVYFKHLASQQLLPLVLDRSRKQIS